MEKKEKIKNEALEAAITKKAQILLGQEFRDNHRLAQLEHYTKYKNDKTVFFEFLNKKTELEAQYAARLKQLGLEAGDFILNNTSDKLKLGEKLGKIYPELLDQAKADAWNKINDVMTEILTGNY